MSTEAPETGQNGQAGSLRRCSATCVDGSPCKAAALPGKTVCLFHSPEAAALLRDAKRRGGLNRAAMLERVDLGPLDWETAAGLKDIMCKAAAAMLEGRLDSSRARALGDLAAKALAAMQGQVLEERLAAIERALAEESDGERQD
jgi:hypothetical protein